MYYLYNRQFLFVLQNEGHKLHAMNAIEKLEQMTRSNNGWILEKEEVVII